MSGKKPDFIGLADWGAMLETWQEAEHQKRCKTNSENASSNPDGLGSHRHTLGARTHCRVAYDMEKEIGQKPASTAVVLKTHTRKDGTCIDKIAESLVAAAQALAIERSQSSSLTEGTVSTPSNHDHIAAYIEKATNDKGRIYGLESMQYLNCHPDEKAAASILRKSRDDEEMEQVKSFVKDLKTDMELLLKINGYDPVTHQSVARESTASAPSPHS